MVFVVFFFFFQAEDGIRDGTVTGVQTCALPICEKSVGSRRAYVMRAVSRSRAVALRARSGPNASRSEEHTSELQSQFHLVCRLLLEKKKALKYLSFDKSL